MKKTFIYGLRLIGDDTIRYIGKSDNPKKRLRSHIYNTKLFQEQGRQLNHKDYWLIKNNFNVEYVVLEECDFNIWQEREMYHIKNHSGLTNTSKGGLGGGTIIYNKSYIEVKQWVQSNLNVKSIKDWRLYVKTHTLPDFIPRDPAKKYKNNGWVSWGDFLGTHRVADNYIERISYDEAKIILEPLNIRSATEYRKLHDEGKLPKTLPKKANRYYDKRGWVSWADYLSNGLVANQLREFYTYEEFKTKVIELGLMTFSAYKKYTLENKTDLKLPTNPNTVYKNKGWVSYQDCIKVT
jgi:hypothetical protein